MEQKAYNFTGILRGIRVTPPTPRPLRGEINQLVDHLGSLSGGISFARSVTGIIVVIRRGVWVCPKELCARAERESQDRQNKYSHHMGVRSLAMLS